jgi:hypothetical protein
MTAGIQDEIRLKNRPRGRWQVTRDPALKAEINLLQRSVTHRLNEWRNDQWSATLESLDPEDQSLWMMTEGVMGVPTPYHTLVTPGRIDKEAKRRSLPRRGQSLRYRLNRWPPLKSNAPKLPVDSRCNLIIPPQSDVRSVLPDGHVISSRHAGWSGSGWVDTPVIVSLYVNDMPKPSHHVELALYADDTAFIATSRKLTLLVSYLQSYINDLQRLLSECRIAINISKSAAIIFARAVRRFIQPRPVTFFGEPIEWFDNTRYLRVTLDK